MKIKKHANGNDYLLVEGDYWVRNFTKHAPAVDINKLTSMPDMQRLIHNQLKNEVNTILTFDREIPARLNVCIISDGYDFDKKKPLLAALPKDVTIIGTNRTLAKWDIKGGRAMNYYVVNNPYESCMAFYPTVHRYFPTCLASIRTYPEFVERYKGEKYKYYPTFEEGFRQTSRNSNYYVDDYRNPICAAVNIAYAMRAVRILLFCCDDVFAMERPAAEQLPNGLWMYPQHRIPHALIEGSLYWLTHQSYRRLRVGNHSSGPEYKDVPYISEEGLNDFFTAEL